MEDCVSRQKAQLPECKYSKQTASDITLKGDIKLEYGNIMWRNKSTLNLNISKLEWD